ncbi:MAG TPA: glycosyltransferase 87 family protein [Candidatus Limnocylindria bacterium]
MIFRAGERAIRWLIEAWRDLSLDAKVVGVVAGANWGLLFANHTTVAATTDETIWRLFPGIAGPAFVVLAGAVALSYPFRDRRQGVSFTPRARWVHVGLILAVFVVVPTLASIVLRETGKPYTYIHDGALMIEEAARKLLGGHNPYAADYLDTPLFYWPMVNNPALYHLTYFPFMFLVTVPFVWAFDHLGIFWDQRYLYLPLYLATLAVIPFLVKRTEHRLAMVALVGLNPQLFPFVIEGRNDFFVLFFLLAGVALLQRERRTLASLAIAAAAASKLHALFLLPFLVVWLVATKRPRTIGAAVRALAPTLPAVIFLAITFGPFLLNDWNAFYDDVVRYNAGGAAWTYPISGVGFSALLLGLGIIPYRQADFPFAAIEIAVAAPIAAYTMWRLWRDPTIARMLAGYALTLLAFLFFGRYFQGNYLGFILAVATPIPFLVRESRPLRSKRRRTAAAHGRTAIPAVVIGGGATGGVEARSVE